jgi:FtsP/CotA-like multicopper oxidase with cupredoxin domain
MPRIAIFISTVLLALAATGADQPKQNYVEVITPNGTTLPWTLDNGVKVYHLIAEKVKREFAPGLVVNCWGYNGQTPGPTIEAVEGDRVRIYVTNKLDAPTTVHWHGIILPNGMDGVSGLTQPSIKPGETFKYEFTLKQHGTFMYHPHFDEMTQIGMGMGGFFIVHPKDAPAQKVDRDFAIMLMEWFIPLGAATPDPTVMLDFNYFTFNSKVFPGTAPLVIKKGQRVRIRLANLSMDNHPIHLHGASFKITGRTGCCLPETQWEEDDTVDVPVGSTRDIEFVADEPGDWPLHCHKTHHTMSGMEHGLPNVLGVDLGDTAKKIEKLLPGYMEMGKNGMGDMMNMGGPPNTLPMSTPGPFGEIEMGGMFTVVKVREDISSYEDPGWYKHPEGTVASRVPDNEIPKDK